MRATAVAIADRAGAYRCLCCGQRTFVNDHDVFERCKGCECSIFEPDWRYSDAPFQANETGARELVD